MADTPGCLDNIPRVGGGLLFNEGVRLGDLPQRMSSHLGKELGKEHLVDVGRLSPLTRHSSQGTLEDV